MNKHVWYVASTESGPGYSYVTYGCRYCEVRVKVKEDENGESEDIDFPKGPCDRSWQIRKEIRSFLKEAFGGDTFFKILNQIAKALMMSKMSIEDVQFIRFKPILRNGKISVIRMQDDFNQSLGGILTSFKQSDADEVDVSLEEIVAFLEENGAKRIKTERRHARY